MSTGRHLLSHVDNPTLTVDTAQHLASSPSSVVVASVNSFNEASGAKPMYLISVGHKQKIKESEMLKAFINLVAEKITDAEKNYLQEKISAAKIIIKTRDAINSKDFLKAKEILESKENHVDVFTKITVLAAGTLQRHNWWLFAKNYTDEELARLLADIPPYITPKALAYTLAEKFLADAQQREEVYISAHAHIVEKLPLALLEHKTRLEALRTEWHGLQSKLNKDNFGFNEKLDASFITPPNIEINRWFDVVPLEFVTTMALPRAQSEFDSNYINRFNELNDILENKIDNKKAAAFRDAFKETIKIFMHRSHNEITKQGQRIKNANINLSNINFNEVAELASSHYLLEELPYLAPYSNSQDFTHIIYPGNATSAICAAKDLVDAPSADWVKINFKSINVERRLAQQQEIAKPFQQLSFLASHKDNQQGLTATQLPHISKPAENKFDTQDINRATDTTTSLAILTYGLGLFAHKKDPSPRTPEEHKSNSSSPNISPDKSKDSSPLINKFKQLADACGEMLLNNGELSEEEMGDVIEAFTKIEKVKKNFQKNLSNFYPSMKNTSVVNYTDPTIEIPTSETISNDFKRVKLSPTDSILQKNIF